MIELNRHIEVLLLSSDCVIVPDLGGFVTHHVEARYDEEDCTFVPPARTLGFNPQLTMNDSLLAQSYIEAYDISYPEAIRRIEAEVAELKQVLQNEGVYEMNGIGELSMNEDGRIVFTPCEAGILTPILYGLDIFEIHRLSNAGKTVAVAATSVAGAPSIVTTASDGKSEDRERESAIVIKMSWLHNVAAIAAAVIAFFVLTPPVANSDEDGQVTMSAVELLPMPKASTQTKTTLPAKTAEPVKAETLEKVTEPAKTDEPEKATKPAKAVEPAIADAPASAETIEPAKTAEAVEPAKVAEPAKAVEQVKTATVPEAAAAKPYFCLVLASQVSQPNAEVFVKQLQARGHKGARVSVNANTRRVIYGNYATKAQAYEALSTLRANTADFDEAWVYEVKD